MSFSLILLLIIFSLVIGSFLGALSYRLPRGISIAKGRSFCPTCGATVSWKDNIPVLSYLLLGGKCRSCRKTISPRYPVIEVSSVLVFLLSYIFYPQIEKNIDLVSHLGLPGLGFFLLVALILVLIFIVDLEHQVIPDSVVFTLLLITLIFMFSVDYQEIFSSLFFGAEASLFLLAVHLITKGKGMGLGDVKLALVLGSLLREKIVLWFFIAFLTGALVGIILILMKRSKLKSRIAFGPFLVVAFFVVSFFGDFLWLNLIGA